MDYVLQKYNENFTPNEQNQIKKYINGIKNSTNQLTKGSKIVNV